MKKYLKLLIVFTIFAFAILVTGCKNKENNKDTKYKIEFLVENRVVLQKEVEKDYVLTSSDFPKTPTKEGYTFDGWYVDTLKISEGYVIVQSTIINAKFIQKTVIETKEDGSKEYPYLIKNSQDLINFADRINHMDEETKDKNYYKAYFELTNDIDMAGVKFTPIGKEIQIVNENEEYTIYGFMGCFDGNGYTIKNLEVSINMKTNKEYYGGLFALTHHAYIHDLSLENINYNVESGSDDATRGIIIGGVVALAELTTFENISVTGVINTAIFENNQAYLGGIAGQWYVADSNNAYFAYARNCYTNVETVIGEIEGEECSLESALNGGLFGYVYNYNSTVSIINSSTHGKVFGGKYVGGLIGYSASDNVSILDSCSYATVYATANEVSYAGGLIGTAFGDTVIKDCFFNGPLVRGTRASSTTYQSYAGGIVGYAVEDDYEVYYSAGIACVNSYYNTSIRGANNTSSVGISTTDVINLDYTVSKLQWDKDAWKNVNDQLVPSNIDIKDENYKVNLIVNDQVVETISKPLEDQVYSLLGNLEDGENFDSQIFYNWQLQEGSEYRFYMPVIKDMNIYAKYYDVSNIKGIYVGTGVLYETIDAGIIVLNEDGSLQWINSSTVGGNYKYDGEHIIFEMYNNIGIVSGTIKDGTFEFLVDAGMSGQVAYTFVKSELSFFGEYFSTSGDILTFSGENTVSFQSTLFNQGSYTSGTYTQEGNVLTISGKYFESTYSSMTIVDNGNMTFTANFISKNPNVPSLENVVFSKILNKDYSNYGFVGEYNLTYVSGSTSPLQSEYVMVFNNDGTGIYKSEYSATNFEYYTFNNGTTIKIVLEGYASEFTYNVDGKFFHGGLNRGTSGAKRSIVITPISEGKINALVINDISNVLFVNDQRSFYVKDGKYQPNANIQIGKIESGSHFKIDDNEYILRVNGSEYTSNIGYMLLLIGKEEGKYTYNGKTINLDGIGNVTGDIKGFYICYENDLVVIVSNDDTFIGFNTTTAKNNNNTITKLEPTTIQGVWYTDYSSTGELKEKYYKLLMDGYGHSAFMYKKVDSETGEFTYEYNWGADELWVDVKVDNNKVSCDYNKYQHCEMLFYYDNNLMYSTNFGYIGNLAMYKDGYTGPMVPPTLPSNVVGSYIGETSDNLGIVLNLRQDLAGTYCGNPYTAVYDGKDTIIFTVNSVTYTFNIKTFVLSYNDINIQLEFNGEIQDVIPEVLCGVWTGTNWTGMGANGNTKVTIEKDGTLKYVEQAFQNVTFDYETMTIYGSGESAAHEEISIVITYNEDTQTIDVTYNFVYDGEDYNITGKGLTKSE